MFLKLSKTTECQIFLLLFLVAVTLLLVLFVVNWFSGKTGTYVDHTSAMWDLVNKKYSNAPPPERDGPSGRQPFESKGEIECRRAVESLTGKPFPKARPSFLRNVVSGQNLELDCYCDELKIAVEYNGEQHYKYIPYFHHSKDAFYNLRYRDEMKKKLCEENGVSLIVVPYTVPFSQIEKFIANALNVE